MNIQFLSKSELLIKPLKDLFLKKGCSIYSESEIDNFFKSCIKYPSNIFIIQSNIESEVSVLDFIKDLRMYFGAFPLILIVGKKSDIINITNFLNVGANNVFEYPYDVTVLEDFLGNSLKRDNFLPILYRNVPSGGTPVEFSRTIFLSQITSDGVEFCSADFITRGTVFNIDLNNLIGIGGDNVRCKIMSSDSNETNDHYSYYAEYFEMSLQLKKEVRYVLKKEMQS